MLDELFCALDRDRDVLLLLADWLEEQGDPTAWAWRHVHEKGWAPLVLEDRGDAFFIPGTAPNGHPSCTAYLPPELEAAAARYCSVKWAYRFLVATLCGQRDQLVKDLSYAQRPDGHEGPLQTRWPEPQ